MAVQSSDGGPEPDAKPVRVKGIAAHQNALKQYSSLGSEVFSRIWGPEWDSVRSARGIKRIDFSGPEWNLETLEGEPERGLLHKSLHREFIEILNISKNQLTDISCLDARKPKGAFEFKALHVLNASRNMLTEFHLRNASLLEINLSHNELDRMPDFRSLTQLQKLLIAHNRLDGTLEQFASLQKLRVLDVSANKFSWKPTGFKKEIDRLQKGHLEEIRFWPNPFAEGFKEYQFVTVTTLDSLTSLDGFVIDTDLRTQLRRQAITLNVRSIDFTMFDIKVDERRKNSSIQGAQASHEQMDAGPVPTLTEIVSVMSNALDHPTELQQHVHTLDQQVASLWCAHFWDRRQLMEIREINHGKANFRQMRAEEEEKAVNEFADRMQQMLGRFESVQDTLVMCLVRLLACGNKLLGERCGTLLAEWVDAVSTELQDRFSSMAAALFKDLRVRILRGIQSIHEKPFECYSAQNGKAGTDIDSQDLAAIAETSSILGALAMFDSAELHDGAVSPGRATVLRPFLPALCRETRSVLGKDHPIDAWNPYVGFDSFLDETAETIEVAEQDIATCREKCVRMSYGGFVTEHASEEGMLKVHFKAHPADVLVGLRRAAPGRTLHARPRPSPKRHKREAAPEVAEEDTNESWNAWVNGLSVLVTATSDPVGAARCVNIFEVHKAIASHDSDPLGFTEAWVVVSQMAGLGFIVVLQLAQNLMRASGEAGAVAARYFYEQRLHINCYQRIRTRLQEGGAPITLSRLNEFGKETVTLIAELTGVFNTMMRASKEVANEAMAKSQEFGMDVFFMLLEVAQATSVPDPLLLAISYETIHVFLNNEIMRPQILARVTGRLRDSATLLPYIRGLTVQDIPNQKYHTLWRLCEIKYGSSKSSTRQRLMELVSDDVEPEDRDLWHDMVPEMRHLTNSLMIRVLLGIVKLIQLFSKEADNDPTGLLKGVTALLNASEREKLLVGPATGLVTCPDFDVKIECMVCIKQVIKSTPEQFDPEEMGWLLRFLTSTGMGVGKQEEFLIKVLEVIDIFIQNNSYSGILFRQRFGKYAIREVFEMLRVNSSRDTHGNEEEGEMRAALSRAITHLLQSCSSPIAGGLKAFLRRGDFTKSAIEVLRNEQELVPQNPDTSLLHTWTCRDLSQVLFPMVCGHSFDLHGVIRYQGMCCLADVLQGKPCRSTDVQHFDESNFWPGLSTLYKHLATHDETEADDTRLQQEYFVSSDGLANLLYSTDRYFACEEFSSTLLMTDSLMEGLKDDVELFLRQAWAGAQEANLVASPTGASSLQDQVQTAKGEDAPGKYIRDCFVARLYSLNASVGELYSCNLKLYSNEKDTFPMIELANLFEKFWMTEEGRHAEQLDDYDDAIGKIMKIPQQVEVQGVLQKVSDFQDRGAPLPKVRQPHRNLDKLLAEAREAHTAMKKALFAFSNPKAATWAKEIPDSDGLGYLGPDPQCATFGPGGLADFLREGEAKVIDHGVMSFREVQMCNEFKWHGRWDHLTSLSSLVIEYPDAEKLLDSYKKILLLTKLITIVSVKNHFLNPTSLGRHSIVLKVEHVFDDFVHISELKLVIAPGIEMQETFPTTVSHWSWLIRKGMKILREDLHLHPDDRCVQVMNFLCMRIESRCIHNGDTVFLRCDDVNLEMQLPGDGVFARSMVPTSHNLFLIERDAGAGVVRSGDTVRLRSKETQKLMEVDMTGRLRCRQVNLDPDEDDFLFAIELSSVKGHHIMADLGSAATALMAGFFSGGSDAVLHEGTKRQQGTHGPRFRGTIHQESKITLRALNQNAKLVTVRRPAANFLIAEEQKLRAVAAPEDKDKVNFRSTQEFVIFRDGSIRLGLGGCRRFFLQDGCLVVPEHDKTLTRQTLDGILQEAMIQAYMGAKLPTQDKCPNDGGVFRRVPPTFATMIWALSGKKQGGFSKASARSVAGSKLLVEMWALSAKHLSGMLRCAFSLLEVPQVAGCRQYVKRKFLEETYEQNATTMRLLTLVATVAQGLSSAANGGNPVPSNELDINTAWLPAKTLRLVSSLLSHIDLVHAAEDPNIYTDFYQSSRSMTAEKQKQRDRLERDFAHADLGRLTFIGVTASYIERMVVPALLAMLGISGSRTMTLQEVVLLHELSQCIACLTQAIYGNEMRCSSNPSDKKSYAVGAITDAQPSGPPVVAEASGAQLQQPLASTGSPGARAAAGGPGAQVASAGVVATISDEASPPSPQNPTGSSTPSSPSQAPRKPKGNVSFALTDDARAKIVNKLFPGTTTKAVVHALLYCIHEEAIAFRSGPRSSDVPVRFLTSLANKSISALAALMNMTGSTQQPESNDASATSREVSCDYHVCEAISQAMTMGRTLVPRARITQLMAERATDALRVAVQDIIDAGGFEAVSKTTYLTERVYTIAFGWAGVVIEGATQQSLSPRLLVITSRFRFAVLEFSAAARSSKAVLDRSDLTVLSCRDLQQLKAVICSPTMRQLLGFQWKKAADSRDQRDQQQVLIFESSARRGDFQRALRIIQRNEAASQKLRLGVPEVRLRQEVTLSLEDVCSPTRDRNPLVNVSFVHEASGQSKSLDVLLLTTITVSVMPLALFLDNYCRKDDFAHYDESNSSVAALDTDSENEALPNAADDEELEEELKVMTGVRVPFELEDLQGVWFVAEASPKMKLQFSTDTLEFTFVSDGERQRFRRKLAQVLAGIDADGGKGDSKGIAKMPWTVVPTAYTSIGDVTKEAMSSSGALALTSGRS